MKPPCIFPTLRYSDADAAIDWLKQAFGFEDHALYRDSDEKVAHAQLSLGSSIVMLGQAREDEYGALTGGKDARRTDTIYVAVEDVDTLYARVRNIGAVVEMPLADTDYGSREFACRDLDDNLWSFGTYWPTVGD